MSIFIGNLAVFWTHDHFNQLPLLLFTSSSHWYLRLAVTALLRAAVCAPQARECWVLQARCFRFRDLHNGVWQSGCPTFDGEFNGDSLSSNSVRISHNVIFFSSFRHIPFQGRPISAVQLPGDGTHGQPVTLSQTMEVCPAFEQNCDLFLNQEK